MLSYFTAGFTAFTLTAIFTLVALWLFPRLRLMDRPKHYGLTRDPIPYYGGIALIAAFLVSIAFFVPSSRTFTGVLVALGLIVVVSFFDDMFQIRPSIRLAVQVLSALIISFFGVGIRSITNPFGGMFVFDGVQFTIFGQTLLLMSILFTVAWIVFVMNSMNFFDGVPGLLSGVSSIGFLVIFLLSLRTGHVIDQTQLIYLSVILFSICLAYVLFDFPSPMILMGDTGSMFLGFLLAVLAIFSGGKVATLLIVLGIPLFDAVWSIIRRLFKRQSPFRGDLHHLHHQLLRAGFSERRVLLVMYSLSAFFGFSALFLQSYEKMLATFAIIFTMILSSLLLFWHTRSAKQSPK